MVINISLFILSSPFLKNRLIQKSGNRLNEFKVAGLGRKDIAEQIFAGIWGEFDQKLSPKKLKMTWQHLPSRKNVFLQIEELS